MRKRTPPRDERGEGIRAHGATAARRTHHPQVSGSNPDAPTTRLRTSVSPLQLGYKPDRPPATGCGARQLESAELKPFLYGGLFLTEKGCRHMSIISAFGFTALGMALAHLYNWLAWRKYYEGKRERDRDRRSGG